MAQETVLSNVRLCLLRITTTGKKGQVIIVNPMGLRHIGNVVYHAGNDSKHHLAGRLTVKAQVQWFQQATKPSPLKITATQKWPQSSTFSTSVSIPIPKTISYLAPRP